MNSGNPSGSSVRRSGVAFLERYPLGTFFAVACVYSWGLWALMIASAKKWLPISFPANPAGSFGPSLAAILLTAFVRGRPGLRELFRPLFRWRWGGRWYLFALLGPAALTAAAVGIHAALGGKVPEPAGLGRAYLLPFLFVIVLIVGGPLGEEIGWRGYALPKMLERRGALASSLVVAALWAVWHVPLFWLEGAAQEGSSIFLFFVSVAAFSVLFTWVYLHTSGSLVAALMLHTSVNVSSVSLSSVFAGLENDLRFSGISTGVLVAAALAVIAVDRSFRVRRMASRAPL